MAASNDLLRELRDLDNKVINSLKVTQGVIEVKEYGSIANKNDDGYSDMDIEVRCVDSAVVVSNLRKLIEKIGGSYTIMPISINEKERVYTVIWKDYSLYHKMDLRILSDKTRPAAVSDSLGYNEGRRKLDDFLVGVVRYTKYRKRKMNWAAYKFFKASIEMWVNARFGKATLESFIELDRKKDTHWYWGCADGTEGMDRALVEITREVVGILSSKEDDFGEDVLKFMCVELGIHPRKTGANS